MVRTFMLVVLFAGVLYAQKVSRVSQYGITWYFDREYETGTFINGDYWVVGPVTIVRITPESIGGTNGSVVNPVPRKQSYDRRAPSYDSSRALKLPATVSPDASVVSTISRNKWPWLTTAAVLTIVQKAPPPETFRPGYGGEIKRFFSFKDINLASLPRLSYPPDNIKTKRGRFIKARHAPDINEFSRKFTRVWLDHLPSDGGAYRAIRPVENLPNYSRETSQLASYAGLAVLMEPPYLRDKLLIPLVQIGIDYYSVATMDTCLWPGGSGQGNGRKWFIVFLGVIFQDKKIASLTFCAGEDQQTYYAHDPALPATDAFGFAKKNVPAWHGPRVLWGALRLRDGVWCRDYEHVPPEQWAHIRPGTYLGGCQSERYRRCCTSHTWVGQALSMRLLNATAYWSKSWFDYVDRWMIENYTQTEQQQLAHIRCNTADSTDIRDFSGGVMLNSSESRFIDACWHTYRASLTIRCKDGTCDKPVENCITCPRDCCTPE
ncbi:MAG: hypothetical protein GF401_00105 [Chitinivibrionales bacterium]|nr:hypothetical protein [Chitinivibrionales bacterium]